MSGTNYSTLAVNTQAAATSKLLDGGFFDIMTGEQPALASDPVPDALRLVRCTFGAVAFGPPRDGVLKANPIGKAVAVGEGQPTWCRCLTKDGEPVVDGTVGKPGETNENGEPVNATGNVEKIVKGQIVAIKEFTHVINKKPDSVFIIG